MSYSNWTEMLRIFTTVTVIITESEETSFWKGVSIEAERLEQVRSVFIVHIFDKHNK